MKTQLAKALSLAACLCFGAASVASAADNTPIRIGAVVPSTGPAAFVGVPQERILKDQVAAINKAGGLGGHPLQLTIYDSEGNTTKAVQFIRRLVDSDNVDVIFGPGTSGESIAAIGAANELKVPLVGFGASVQVTDPVTPYVFQVAPSDKIGVPALLAALQKRGFKKVGLVTTADGYGQSGGGLIKSMAPNYGLSIAAAEEMNRQDTDTTAQVLRLRQAAVDVAVIWVSPPAAQVVLRSMKSTGFNKPIFNSYAAATMDVLTQAGPAAEGTYVISQRLGTKPEGLSDSDRFKPMIAKMSNDYSARYKDVPTQFGGLAYDALLLLENGVKIINGGPVNRETLRAAFEKAEFDGANGHFKFSPTNHNGLDANSDSILVMVARKGAWVVSDN